MLPPTPAHSNLHTHVHACPRMQAHTHVPLASLIPAVGKKNTLLLRSWRGRLGCWVLRGTGAQRDSPLLPSSNHHWVRPSWVPCSCLRSLVCWVWQQQSWFVTVAPGWPSSPTAMAHVPVSVFPDCADRAIRGAQSLVGRTAEHKSSSPSSTCWLTSRPWTNCFFLNN